MTFDPRLDSVRHFWDVHAKTDPLWAVLSDPSKSGRRWRLQEFMETGEREISLLLYQLKQLGLTTGRAAALDFGCGVGRLTQALARRFESAVGLDVSPRMIELARRLDKHPPRVEYVLSAGDGLDVLSGREFDLIYSNIVLQHLEPDLIRRHLTGFVPLLRRGGIAVFQLPSHRRTPAPGPTAMPAAAYAAALRLLGDCPAAAPASSWFQLLVEVRNSSPHAWSTATHGAIRLGNHWRAADGSMMIQDDGRADLPVELAAGERCLVPLSVTTPAENATLCLEIDVVHEGITWFGDRNSPVLQLPVAVGAVPRSAVVSSPGDPIPAYADEELERHLAASDAGGEAPAAFPMHGVERDDVIALLGASGATVVHVEDDGRGGADWVGYRYYAVRN